MRTLGALIFLRVLPPVVTDAEYAFEATHLDYFHSRPSPVRGSLLLQCRKTSHPRLHPPQKKNTQRRLFV